MATLLKGMNGSKTRGLAYVNHSRWLVDCPACGAAIRIDPAQGDRAICGNCNPGLFAIRFVRRVVDGEESFYPVPDERKRAETARTSTPFAFVLPPDWEEIFRILRLRPVANMNWLPGETLQHLIAENIQHGLQNVEV